MSHRGSLLCLPSGIYGWDVTDAAALNEDALSRVFAEVDSIDTLLVGTGRDIAPFPTDLRQRLREGGIVTETMSTGAAVRTYNVLLAEDRLVTSPAVLSVGDGPLPRLCGHRAGAGRRSLSVRPFRSR
jgi:uncharacterized protein